MFVVTGSEKRHNQRRQNMTSTFDRHSLGTTLLRLIVGVTFIAHGATKLFSFGVAGTAGFLGTLGVPLANVMAPVLIATELGGGILLVLGLLTRYVSVPLAFTMAVAIATVHLQHGFFLPQGYEFALLLGVASLTLGLQGSGAFALDNVVFGRQSARDKAAYPQAA
jgi:putative oxidoreductase